MQEINALWIAVTSSWCRKVQFKEEVFIMVGSNTWIFRYLHFGLSERSRYQKQCDIPLVIYEYFSCWYGKILNANTINKMFTIWRMRKVQLLWTEKIRFPPMRMGIADITSYNPYQMSFQVLASIICKKNSSRWKFQIICPGKIAEKQEVS